MKNGEVATSGGRAALAGPLAGERLDQYGLFVDGRWQEPGSGRFDDRCPTTGEVVARAPDASRSDMEAAIGVARRRFDAGGWSNADPAFRNACLEQLGKALQEARSDLVALGRVEWGCTADEDLLQIDAPAFMPAATAALARVPVEEELAATGSSGRVLLRHEPVGVVGLLTPWNFPHTINVMKLAPALAAGNTVVLKPSPLAPLAALALARLAEERTEIPAGVFNVVTTSSLEASQALVSDPRVDMISFTGSTSTGQAIMSMAGATLKRLLLELGGKSPTVLLEGADLDKVLPKMLLESCTLHAGQACILRSRLIVPRSLHDEVVGRLAALAEQVVVGDPLSAEVTMGPLISAGQLARVEQLVETAVREGAELATGGHRIEDAPAGGHFFAPTVLGRVAPGSTVAQTEVFGPVLCVIPYDTVDEAVAIANDSIYGLAGSVVGPDADLALEVARRLRTGQVSVNGRGLGDAPFGGFKQSGLGREGGLAGLRQYTETKAIGLPA